MFETENKDKYSEQQDYQNNLAEMTTMEILPIGSLRSSLEEMEGQSECG